MPPNASINEIIDLDDNLYHLPPLPPNPTGPQIKTGLHDKSIADACNPFAYLMEMDDPPEEGEDQPSGAYDPANWPEDNNSLDPWDITNAAAGPSTHFYTPSRPQSGTAQRPMN